MILVINHTIINCIKSIKQEAFMRVKKRNGIFSLACVFVCDDGAPCAQGRRGEDTKACFSWRALSGRAWGRAAGAGAKPGYYRGFNGTRSSPVRSVLFKKNTVVAAGRVTMRAHWAGCKLVVKLHVPTATTGSGVPSGTKPTLYAGARRRPI